MKKVFKYRLEVEDYQTVMLPKGTTILTVKEQRNAPCLYCLINPDEKQMVEVQFRLAGTGHEISDDEAKRLHYIGTFMLYNDAFVGHLFYMEKEVAIPVLNLNGKSGRL